MTALRSVAGAALGLALAVGAAHAQSDSAVDVAVSAGLYADYPDYFSDRYCDERPASLSLSATKSVADRFSIRGALSRAGAVGGATCAIPGLPAPLPGSESSRTVVSEDIRGTGYVSSEVSLVYDALAAGPLRTRVRLGAGRIWDKSLWMWSWGVEARVGSTSRGLVFGIDGLNVGHDATFQRIRWGGTGFGPDVLLESRALRISERPVRFWTGFEFTVGG